MKNITKLAGIALVCCASAAMATDLTLEVTTSDIMPVPPGATVSIDIEGTLSSSVDNEGLALFGVDMSVSGPAAVNLSADASIGAPIDGSMDSFVSPEGLNNPDTCGGCFGYGGTASGDDLLQIGGGGNTIGNTIVYAPFPIGTVVTGIAQTTQVLATGTITMPTTPGTYNINLANGFANVISQGELGPTVYATEAVVTVTHIGLTIEVSDVPPVITAVDSVRDHGGSPLAIDVTGGGVEPRLDGVQKLEVTFDMAMDPATTGPGNVSVTGFNSGAYGGIITTSLSGDGLVLTIDFDTPLADQDCHTVDLAGMQSLSGVPLAASTFDVIGLEGDVDQNGVVATTDAGIIKPRFGDAADASNAKYDVDTNGTIATTDFGVVKPRFGNSPGCP